MASPKDKKGKFASKASERFSGKSVSMAELLSDEEEGREPEESGPKTGNAQNRKTAKPQMPRSSKKEAPKPALKEEPVSKEEPEVEPEEDKVEHTERHFFYFSEALTNDINQFMWSIKPREKNKNRLMRVLLHMFFDRPKEEQEVLYQEALEKFKDLVG